MTLIDTKYPPGTRFGSMTLDENCQLVGDPIPVWQMVAAMRVLRQKGVITELSAVELAFPEL